MAIDCDLQPRARSQFWLGPPPADQEATFTVTRSGSLPAETVYVSTVQTEGYSNSGDYSPLSNQGLSFSS